MGALSDLENALYIAILAQRWTPPIFQLNDPSL